MKKKLKGSRWFLLLVLIILCLPLILNYPLAKSPVISNIEWNCEKRPCRVRFDLEKDHSSAVDVRVEIRGYNFSSDLALPRPKILVGKREFTEKMGTEKKRSYSEEVKFTRYPDKIEISIVK